MAQPVCLACAPGGTQAALHSFIHSFNHSCIRSFMSNFAAVLVLIPGDRYTSDLTSRSLEPKERGAGSAGT